MGMLRFMSPSLSTPFHSVLVSVSVFTALSTVFHSINSPDNSPLSDSVLPVLLFSALLVLSTVYLFCESLPQPWYNPLWLTGLKAPTNKHKTVAWYNLHCWLAVRNDSSLYPRSWKTPEGPCRSLLLTCLVFATPLGKVWTNCSRFEVVELLIWLR